MLASSAWSKSAYRELKLRDNLEISRVVASRSSVVRASHPSSSSAGRLTLAHLLPSDENESNPFISRDEFLLNRFISNNEACPPWIDLQQQLDATVNTFRQTLRGDWVRRAIRMITLPGLEPLSKPEAIPMRAQAFRDPDWEAKERSVSFLSLVSMPMRHCRFVSVPLLTSVRELATGVSTTQR